MERYQVILAYDGSHYQGFQRQANARSVQDVVERALRKLGWQGISILASGRTDTGVHAAGQVIAFDLHWEHELSALQSALNANLPPDVVVRDVHKVGKKFHPRYDASWRKYSYRIFCQAVRQPLLEPYAWRVWPAVDLHQLEELAPLLVGSHDFAAFGTPPQAGGSTVRLVLEAGWMEQVPYLIFEITAQAFLYHMVRRIVFMQVSIAKGKLSRADLENALKSDTSSRMNAQDNQTAPGRLVHGLAPARGLILAEVHYPAQALLMAEDHNKNKIYK